MSLIILVAVLFIPTMIVGLFFPESISLFIFKNWQSYIITLIVVALCLIYRSLKIFSKDIKTNRLHKGREVIITNDTLMLTPSLIEEKSSFRASIRKSFNMNRDHYLLINFKDIVSWTFIDEYSRRTLIQFHEIRFIDRWCKEIEFNIHRAPFRSLFNNTDRQFTNSIKEKLGARFNTRIKGRPHHFRGTKTNNPNKKS